MQITIKVVPDIALLLHQWLARSDNQEAGQEEPLPAQLLEMLEVADTLGLKLKPMHTAATAPPLDAYFMSELAEGEAVDSALWRIRQCAAIEGAYIKPIEAIP